MPMPQEMPKKKPVLQMSEEQLETFKREFSAYQRIRSCSYNARSNSTNGKGIAVSCKCNHIPEYVGFLPPANASTQRIGLVLELINGVNLYQFSTCGKGFLPETQKLDLMRQLAEALLFLHVGCKLVHRDVKPQNAMLVGASFLRRGAASEGVGDRSLREDDVQLKLCDFGKTLPLRTREEIIREGDLAAIPEQHRKRIGIFGEPSDGPEDEIGGENSSEKKMAASIPVAFLFENGGSPRYMAPESFHRYDFVTDRVDVWAFGCFGIELYGQQVPWASVEDNERVARLISQDKLGPPIPGAVPESVGPLLQLCFQPAALLRPCVAEAYLWIKRLLKNKEPVVDKT
mmetsp:Transcript_5058/g.12792  ORF Transcript_5058/g.12792 Transcript_5058/m.12792 type:complete len:345 (-) Transcript_5058:105-1139(-)